MIRRHCCRGGAQVARHGFKSCAAFPICVRKETQGTLNVYAKEADYFREAAIALLTEASEDISFALDNLAAEEERDRLEKVAESERQFSAMMIESMPGALLFLR